MAYKCKSLQRYKGFGHSSPMTGTKCGGGSEIQRLARQRNLDLGSIVACQALLRGVILRSHHTNELFSRLHDLIADIRVERDRSWKADKAEAEAEK